MSARSSASKVVSTVAFVNMKVALRLVVKRRYLGERNDGRIIQLFGQDRKVVRRCKGLEVREYV
ncbi:hypothetical protein AB1M95_16860 [Sulfitobacter sp. LCG007]